VIRCDTVEEEPDSEPFTIEVDAVAVCTGTNTYASLPTFPGQENFKGEIIHAESYRTPERFAGKRVLVVGSGESGSDITNEISKHASKVAIAIRGKHGHLIPRIQADGRVTDLNTNRCRYSNPYVFGDWIGYVNQLAKMVMAKFSPPSEKNKVLRKIAELNMAQKTSAFSKFGCKNEGFVTAIVERGAELHRDAFELEVRLLLITGSLFKHDWCDSHRLIKQCSKTEQSLRTAMPWWLALDTATPSLSLTLITRRFLVRA
jgi:dimethylaniline monooxygenase (N-oxide forming)